MGNPERERQGQDRDKDRDIEKVKETETRVGWGWQRLNRGNSSVRMGMCICVCVQFFACGFPSQSLWPPSLSPAPLSQHHLPGMSFPRWSFLTWTPGSNRPDLSVQRGDSAPSQASLPWLQGKTWLPEPVPSGITARPQDALDGYPMGVGKDRKWDRSRGMDRLTQRPYRGL